VLGICRGIQVVNVAEGGTLHQHLPAVEGTVQHEQRNIDYPPFHTLRLEPGSIAAEAAGTSW
jgi:putative glutamine amidotransferase